MASQILDTYHTVHQGFKASSFHLIFVTASTKVFTEGYRDARWGMTVDQVKRVFPGKQFKEENDHWYFKDNIFGDDAKVGFQFYKGQLSDAFIVLRQILPIFGTIEEIRRARTQFFTLLDALKKKYGTPIKTKTKADDCGLGEEFALQEGHGSYGAIWQTKESRIGLILGSSGMFKPVVLSIGYQSLYHKKLKEKAEIEEKL